MRRCTVWTHQTWHDKQYTYCRPKYDGWLIQVDPHDGYNAKCVIINEQGRLLHEDANCVQVQTPERVPLLHGAPRRADSDEISAAASAAPSTN